MALFPKWWVVWIGHLAFEHPALELVDRFAAGAAHLDSFLPQQIANSLDHRLLVAGPDPPLLLLLIQFLHPTLDCVHTLQYVDGFGRAKQSLKQFFDCSQFTGLCLID